MFWVTAPPVTGGAPVGVVVVVGALGVVVWLEGYAVSC